MQIQISWLVQKPTDLNLHCLQRQGISGFSRTSVKMLFNWNNTVSWKAPLVRITYFPCLIESEFRGRRRRTCWAKSHRSHNLNVVNSFAAKFQTTFVVCFFFKNKPPLRKKFICEVERLNVKQRRSRWDGSLWAVSSGSMLFAKAFYYRLWQWKS